MSNLLHILGADIPHHNHSLLRFFNDDLWLKLAEKSEQNQTHSFYVVSQEDLTTQYPNLSINVFPNKKALTQAVLAFVKSQADAYFLLHGQFNWGIWFAILWGKLPAYRCIWHVWGADLYQQSTDWRFKLLYPLRRLAQQKIGRIWATKGDLDYAHQKLNRRSEQDRLVYFPTRMPQVVPSSTENKTEQPLTILVGNSGDRANQHCLALQYIQQTFGAKVQIILPMGYPANNHAYIEQVRQQALALFPEKNITLLTEKLDYHAYLDWLKDCDMGCFLFERQQGIGTICLLTAMNIPVLLHPNNPFKLDMQQENVPFMEMGQCSAEQIKEVAEQLVACDKQQIAFFPPNYQHYWLENLQEIARLSHYKR